MNKYFKKSKKLYNYRIRTTDLAQTSKLLRPLRYKRYWKFKNSYSMCTLLDLQAGVVRLPVAQDPSRQPNRRPLPGCTYHVLAYTSMSALVKPCQLWYVPNIIPMYKSLHGCIYHPSQALSIGIDFWAIFDKHCKNVYISACHAISSYIPYHIVLRTSYDEHVFRAKSPRKLYWWTRPEMDGIYQDLYIGIYLGLTRSDMACQGLTRADIEDYHLACQRAPRHRCWMEFSALWRRHG